MFPHWLQPAADPSTAEGQSQRLPRTCGPHTRPGTPADPPAWPHSAVVSVALSLRVRGPAGETSCRGGKSRAWSVPRVLLAVGPSDTRCFSTRSVASVGASLAVGGWARPRPAVRRPVWVWAWVWARARQPSPLAPLPAAPASSGLGLSCTGTLFWVVVTCVREGSRKTNTHAF